MRSNAHSYRNSLIDLFCAGFEAMPERIVLDIDDTGDAVHGGQQLALFNAHYDDYCFQPIHIFEAATGKPVLSLLRPGKRPSGKEVARILRHVIRRIRHNWPRVRITVRGDGHYGTPDVMEFLEDQGCGYIFGLSGNARLSKCQRRSKISPPGRSKTSPLNVMRYAVLGGCPGSP